MKKLKWLLLATLTVCGWSANAEITDQSTQHFVVAEQFKSNKSLAEVYRQFTQVSQWWEADHSFLGNADNLFFDFDKQRCFCEKVDGGGFIQHLEVIHVRPQKQVVFNGGLGPLQDQPVIGKMIWTFELVDKAVLVKVEYRVFGMIIGGMGQWPKAVDFVVTTQVKRLKALL